MRPERPLVSIGLPLYNAERSIVAQLTRLRMGSPPWTTVDADKAIPWVEQKLANPAFTQKVPVTVLAEHQKRLAEWQAKKAHFLSALDALGDEAT